MPSCKATATSLTGWFIVSVTFLHNDPNQPNPPGGRTQDAIAPDLLFDKLECRSAWCAKADVPEPPPAKPPGLT